MKCNIPTMLPPSIVTNLQGRASEQMPAVTMTNTELLINDFLYLVPVTIPLPDRLAYPAAHFKTSWSIYAKDVIQFIAFNGQMYNLQTELRSRVIDSPLKVTSCFLFFQLYVTLDAVKEEKAGSRGTVYSLRKLSLWRMAEMAQV